MAIPQNSDYDVVSFSEVASIINHFSPEMIEDIVTRGLESRQVFTGGNPYNLPMALEANYNSIKMQLYKSM